MSGRPTHLALALAATIAACTVPPALADFRVERELALAPGGRFTLDTDSGAVEVRGVDRSSARVVVTSPRDDIEERYELRFEEGSDGALVRVERRRGLAGWWRFGGDRLQFKIELPRRVALDLSTAGGTIDLRAIEGAITASTSGGAIGAAELGGSVELQTSGGSIQVEDVDGDLEAETSGGPIRVAGVSGDATLETSGGSIEVGGVGGRLRAHTSGGSVRASFAPGNASGGSLSTSGGGITALLDPAVALDIDASTSGGRVTVDLPVTIRGSASRNAIRGSLNGGGALLKLRTSGGSIRLRSL